MNLREIQGRKRDEARLFSLASFVAPSRIELLSKV